MNGNCSFGCLGVGKSTGLGSGVLFVCLEIHCI